MVHRRIFALSLIALGLCLGRARAQAGPDVFGIQDEGITIVGYQEFFPIYSSCGYSAGDERWCDGQMKAGINMIPNGALVTQVVFYVRDDDSLMNFIGWLCWSSVHSSSGQALLADCQTGSPRVASRARQSCSKTLTRRCRSSIGRTWMAMVSPTW
jgi:hypothetical protein